MPHFTLTYGPIGPLIHAFIGVSQPRLAALIKVGAPIPPPIVVKALVDTGASHTVVDPTILKGLALSPRRIAKTLTPTTGAAPVKCYTYDVSIHVPLGVATALFSKHAWEVTCLDLKHQGFEVLLGRDVLSEGLLVYDGKAGTFSMAF
jgi:hypothetical protein